MKTFYTIAVIDPNGLDSLYYNNKGDLLETRAGEGTNVVYVDGTEIVGQQARETMVNQAMGAGKFNETGGFVVVDPSTGEDRAAPVPDGQTADPTKGDAHVILNSDDAGVDPSTVKATYHSHPDGTKDVYKYNQQTGQVDQFRCGFNQTPSPADISNAYSPTNYVLSRQNKTVYIYNKSGVITTFPMKKFKTVGK